MADRDEQGPLVDRVDDRAVVLAHDHLEVRLRLVEVAHRREVAALVDDAVPRRARLEAGADHSFGDRHVLVHHGRAGRRPDDPAYLVADPQWQLPPALSPGPDPALSPGASVLRQPLLRSRRHRAERVVDQVRGVLEDRELGAVVEQLAHAAQSACRDTSARDVSKGLSLDDVRKRRFRRRSRDALASRRASSSSLAAAEPGLVPRHLPRRRAAADHARRPRPRGVVQASRQRAAALRLEDPRLVPARQPLPPARRGDPARPLEWHAAAQRRLCDALQPSQQPRRASLPGPVRDARDRGREPPRDGDGVHLRERDPRRTSAAGRGAGWARRRAGLCWNG